MRNIPIEIEYNLYILTNSKTLSFYVKRKKTTNGLHNYFEKLKGLLSQKKKKKPCDHKIW